jgi:hypothetical protein
MKPLLQQLEQLRVAGVRACTFPAGNPAEMTSVEFYPLAPEMGDVIDDEAGGGDDDVEVLFAHTGQAPPTDDAWQGVIDAARERSWDHDEGEAADG